MLGLDKFYIDGSWVPSRSDQCVNVINPSTEKSVGVLAMGSGEDTETAIAAARRAFPSYSALSPTERVELLSSIIAAYQNRIEEVADAISTEMGAPYESLALPFQAGALLGHFQVMVELLKTYNFYEDQGTTRVQREPIGVCGLITPWNWPMNQVGCKVAPALAAGCTMVLKPSELAPLSSLVLADIFHEAGVPKGVFNLVNGDGPTVGAILASHPDIDFVSFTGSTRAGVSVSQAAAPTIKRVALELGGKSANIILDDADLPSAIAGGVMAMTFNTGQSCNAPSRMFVPHDKLQQVEEIAIKTVASVVVGGAHQQGVTMGPLANKSQFEKVQSLIQVGLDEGARLLCGGTGKPEGNEVGYFVKPTIFSDVSNDMVIAREEIFGPVLCIIAYTKEEEAVAMANDSEYGLSGYVSSASLSRAQAIASQLRTGNVHINGAGPDFAATFGGYKKSGLGREWGKHGFEEFLEIKSVLGHNSA